jgi:hypothetical protein
MGVPCLAPRRRRRRASRRRATPRARHQPPGRCSPAPRDAKVVGLQDFEDILARWIDAERNHDASALDSLLDPAFQGDGPDGYVLSKPEWLERHRRGDLADVDLVWRETRRRIHGDTAVVMGVQSRLAHQGRGAPIGDFQVTLVAVRRRGRWAVVNVQITPAAPPPSGVAGDDSLEHPS